MKVFIWDHANFLF